MVIFSGCRSNSYDTDITVVNSGSYKADGDTLGIYAGFNTGVLMLSAGFGQGDFDMNAGLIWVQEIPILKLQEYKQM